MTRLSIICAALLLVLAGCGSEGAVGVGNISDVVSTPATTPTSGGGGSTSVPQMQYQAWLTRDDRLWPVMRSAPRTPAVGATALAGLLDGATADEAANGVGTAIPSDTRLLGLSIADGTATVDLSSEYASGEGARSISQRLAQVVYTLTQFPTVKRVLFHLDGQPVTVFSNAGLALDRPQTRRDYESLLPVIAVITPSAGAEVSSPVTVSGLANVFEANVSVEILDGDGHVIADDVTTASCGTGCWGSFSLDLPYTVEQRQDGTIVVHDDDAAGSGTYPHEVRVPVVLVP
jgi:immunoglobulin-like protein involved in spore germination/sporulation and spore germination protein